ncbi:hypothetical protein [Actinomadura kijaniata]|uniref:hypothetical protein n=1 Tax=Actinomadura kijaniata TaxID=46161 RepID=UPI0008339BE0|nr:hypothetical protein [Actinomadura kijaniata]
MAMTDRGEAASRKPGSADGCVGCTGLGILLAGIAFGPSSVLAAIADDRPKVPVLPLAWAIPLTVITFVAAEPVIRRLAGRAGQGTPLGSWWRRLSFVPLFLVHGVLVTAGHDWSGSVTTVLAAILGVLLAMLSPVSAWSGDLPAMLARITAFAAWTVAAFTTGPGRTALVGGVIIAVLAGMAWLRAGSSRSRPAV